jgi:hypothetical protein
MAAARGEALRDDLNDIAGTSLDKGELDALAKLPTGERKRNIDRGKAVARNGVELSRPRNPARIVCFE